MGRCLFGSRRPPVLRRRIRMALGSGRRGRSHSPTLIGVPLVLLVMPTSDDAGYGRAPDPCARLRR